MAKAESVFERAKRVLPGGVCASTRLSVARGMPFYIEHGAGSKVFGPDGKEYIDLNCAHGASLLGHNHPAIREALQKAMDLGCVCSAETEYQVLLAERLCEIIPCMEKARFCTSGSEATLHLIRACRGYTGRDKILRLEGHFHGYHEMIYIGGQPPMDKLEENRHKPYIESAGIPEVFRDLIVTAPFNDLEALEKAVAEHPDEIATLILEPVNYNSGGIQPEPGYLEAVRRLTRKNGILLFYDEIQSSFKKSRGGAQQDFGVIPDVCTIGKSVGGGVPLSVFGGRADVMDQYKPAGPVQHSGTFNAHLLQVLAGLAFLEQASDPGFYPRLQAIETRLHEGLDRIVSDLNIPVLFPHHGARFNVLMGLESPPKNYADLKAHDHEKTFEFFRQSTEHGVYYHDYGRGFPGHCGYSVQHTDEDIDRVLEVTQSVFRNIY